MRKICSSIVLAVVSVSLLLMGAPSAQAVTICIAPCDGSLGQPVDPIDLSGLATEGIEGFVLESGDFGLSLEVDGDLVIHVPSGTLVSTVVDLRALESIQFDGVGINTGTGPTSLCADPACEALAAQTLQFSADPFHLTVLGPLNGPLEVFARGNVLLTTTPVPEPGTGLLVAIGLAGLARARSRRRSS